MRLPRAQAARGAGEEGKAAELPDLSSQTQKDNEDLRRTLREAMQTIAQLQARAAKGGGGEAVGDED